MSERVCVRGCVRKDVHYATCTRRPPEYEGDNPCRGCAPRECREGSLICDTCFGRMRALLEDVPDLLARLRALADPAKATPTDQAPSGRRSTEPPAPVGSDLLDAIAMVEVANMWDERHLRMASNDRLQILDLGELLLTRHPEVDGLREHWSVQDAVDRWGVERRDPHALPWVEDSGDGEIASFGMPEWGEDRPVSQQDAVALVGVSRFTIARWARKGWLKTIRRVPTGPRGSRKTMYLLSELRAAYERDGDA